MKKGHSTAGFRRVVLPNRSSYVPAFVALCMASLLTGCNTTKESSDPGLALFSQHCSVCHGSDGGGLVGPAIMGNKASLQKYGNAQSLLEYISTTMPQNHPGGLTEKAYRDLLAFLLMRNNFVSSEWKPQSGDLRAIQLCALSAPNCATDRGI